MADIKPEQILGMASPEQVLGEAIMKEKDKRNWKRFILEVVGIMLAVLLIFNFLISVSTVSGVSMRPNFDNGDKIIAFRLAKNFKIGDVIIFNARNGKELLKRVVATAGDTVDISPAGGLIVNGQPVQEPNIYEPTRITDRAVSFPQTVQKDCLFVMGDNRVNSIDSRTTQVGQVEEKSVVGRVILVIRGI